MELFVDVTISVFCRYLYGFVIFYTTLTLQLCHSSRISHFSWLCCCVRWPVSDSDNSAALISLLKNNSICDASILNDQHSNTCMKINARPFIAVFSFVNDVKFQESIMVKEWLMTSLDIEARFSFFEKQNITKETTQLSRVTQTSLLLFKKVE